MGSTPTPGTNLWLHAAATIGVAAIVFRKSTTQKLESLSDEITHLRESLRVADEQLAHFVDEAEDARLRSLVSDSSQAVRESRSAASTVTAYKRDRERTASKLVALEQKQDKLLEVLFEENG